MEVNVQRNVAGEHIINLHTLHMMDQGVQQMINQVEEVHVILRPAVQV